METGAFGLEAGFPLQTQTMTIEIPSWLITGFCDLLMLVLTLLVLAFLILLLFDLVSGILKRRNSFILAKMFLTARKQKAEEWTLHQFDFALEHLKKERPNEFAILKLRHFSDPK